MLTRTIPDSASSDPPEASAAETIAAGSRNFAAAACLFDRRTRDNARLLYVWCRYCDDCIDGQTLGHAGPWLARQRDPAATLVELEAGTRAAFAGAPGAIPAFRALQLVAHRCALPETLALDHLAGFAMDAQGARYESLPDTLRYCYHVAGIVGIMMALVMGARSPRTLDRACDLGIAFQLTNIARDIVEDALRGRVYLPQDWLDAAALPADALADPGRRETVVVLSDRLLAAAEPYYASALEGLADLPLRSAWAIATAHGAYRAVGQAVKAQGTEAWESRVTTSAATKLAHMLKGGGLALASRCRRGKPRPSWLWQRPALTFQI